MSLPYYPFQFGHPNNIHAIQITL